jgi:asparagine synthase (glutamine-hydrolysing)
VCGITGFTHCNKHPSPAIIRTSTLALHHRGPDEQAVFESPNASLGVARLKIIDLEGGQQPMVTERGDWVIAFNGEIYNHAELRSELEQLGHEFRSHCDTEVALRAFTQWDVDCFSRFRGMFAAAFWHERERRLVLVRDRLGVKPLYYTLDRGDIFFGSELKAIFAHHQLPRKICRRALGYYLSLNYIPGPLTLVEGIEKVDPGTWLEWKNGQVSRFRYWRNVMRPEHIPIEEASCELDRLLAQSVREHLISDVPVGIWASGGIDSATVLHYAANQCTSPMRTFSVSFRGRSCDESRYFRSLVAHYGTRHQELDLNSDLDLTSAIHELAYYSDEPSADAGAVPVWFLSRMTARDVTVALSGEGADEVFGGYETYLADRYARVARRLPKPLLESALTCARRLPVSDRKISFEYKLKRFLAGALLPADEAHFFWNGTFSREEQHTIASGHKPESLYQLVAQLSCLPEEDDLNRYLFLDQHWYLPDDILYKCDRMSMAHSLEVRPPFLDHRIVEFAARLPLDLKIRGGNTKVILRKLIRGKVPNGILNRNKEGLDIPAHEWLRGPLRPLLLEALSPETVRKVGLLSSALIQKLIAQHSSRRANLGYHLWGLITLHLWIRRWNIQTEDQAAFVPLCGSATAAG